MNETFELLRQGGVAMALILLGSVASVALFVERLVALSSLASRGKALHDEVLRALLRGDPASARGAAERARTPSARIYRAALERHAHGVDPGGPADRERRATLEDLRGPVWLLGTIGATMPFIGLFGTVMGILRSFRQMATAGTGGFTVVAGGISEALITTAGGIAVAIEAVVLYNWLSARIGRDAARLSVRTEELVETLIERPAPTPTPGVK